MTQEYNLVCRVYEPGTELNSDSRVRTDGGKVIPDIINEPGQYSTITEDLVSSEKYLTFSYPLDGVNIEYIKAGNHVLYPDNKVRHPDTRVSYDLFTITNITVDTDDATIVEVEAHQYTVNFMRDDVARTFRSIDYVAPSVSENWRGEVVSSSKEENVINSLLRNYEYGGAPHNVGTLKKFNITTESMGVYGNYRDENSLDVGAAGGEITGVPTLGALLIGSNSVFRKYFKLYVRRYRNIVEPFYLSKKVEKMPLVLGANVARLNYEIDITEIVSELRVNPSTIPTTKVRGYIVPRLTNIDSDILGLRYSHPREFPVGNVYYFLYRGIPIYAMNEIRDGKTLTILGAGYSGQLINPHKERDARYNINVELYTYEDVEYIEFTQNGEILLSEPFDINEFKFYRMVAASGPTSDRYYYDTRLPYTMFEDGSETEEGEIYYSEIPKYEYNLSRDIATKYGVSVSTPGRPVKYIDFEDNKSYPGEELEERFMHWYLKRLGTGQWNIEDGVEPDYYANDRRYTEPTFKATLGIDELTDVFGTEYIRTHVFEVGQKYKVNAEQYGLEFETVLTKTVFNGLEQRILEVEFTNEIDLEDLD